MHTISTLAFAAIALGGAAILFTTVRRHRGAIMAALRGEWPRG